MGWFPDRKEGRQWVWPGWSSWILQCGLSVPLYSENLNKIQQSAGPLDFLKNNHFSKLSFWKYVEDLHFFHVLR